MRLARARLRTLPLFVLHALYALAHNVMMLTRFGVLCCCCCCTHSLAYVTHTHAAIKNQMPSKFALNAPARLGNDSASMADVELRIGVESKGTTNCCAMCDVRDEYDDSCDDKNTMLLLLSMRVCVCCDVALALAMATATTSMAHWMTTRHWREWNLCECSFNSVHS